MEPKIAVCFYGMLGRYNQDKNSIPKDCSNALKSLFKNVLSDVDYDIFAHTWSNQNIKKTFDYIKPKTFSVTPPIQFSKLDQLSLYISALKRGFGPLYYYLKLIKFDFEKQQKVLNNIMSRYYSSAVSVLLMKQFVEKTSTKYSHVMITRYDLEYFSKFDFSKLSLDKIYFGDSCDVLSKDNQIIPNQFYWEKLRQNHDLKLVKRDFIRNKRGLEDFWFICNYDNSIIMSKLFDKINFYIKSGIKPNSHQLLEHHVYKNFSDLEIDFYKTRLIDFDMSRRFQLNDTN